MVPGPKKKRGVPQKNTVSETVVKTIPETQKPAKQVEVIEEKTEENAEHSGKFSKRLITSNWERYNEPVEQKGADVLYGSNYEVVLSSSGAAGSQFRLKSEKDWDENEFEDKIVFDLDRFSHAVKCIPFHKRQNIPEAIFDSMEIQKFNEVAETNKKSILTLQTGDVSSRIKPVVKHNNTNFNVTEAPKHDFVFKVVHEEQNVETPSSRIDDATDNLIQSLSLSLRLKDPQLEVKSDSKMSNSSCNGAETEDNLDFLLSMSLPTDNISSDNLNAPEKTLDWLDDLLDD